MNDMPTYSDDGIGVLDAFYQDYVAVIVYFEDEHHEAVYERILLRLIPRLRSFQVICLGGKSKLIAKAKEKRPVGAKWLFVFDKDFDDLLGCIFEHEDVYYLRAFSLENYFIDLQGIAKLAVEMDPRRLTVRSVIEQCAAFPAYLARLRTSLERIARLFVVARRYRIEIPTAKLPVEELLQGADVDDPVPTQEWYEEYRKRFIGALSADAEWLAQDDLLRAEMDRALLQDDRVNFPVIPEVDHICGKHFLGCVLRALQAWLGVRFLDLDVVEMYLRLAGHIDLRRLAFLEHSISSDHPDLIRA